MYYTAQENPLPWHLWNLFRYSQTVLKLKVGSQHQHLCTVVARKLEHSSHSPSQITVQPNGQDSWKSIRGILIRIYTAIRNRTTDSWTFSAPNPYHTFTKSILPVCQLHTIPLPTLHCGNNILSSHLDCIHGIYC